MIGRNTMQSSARPLSFSMRRILIIQGHPDPVAAWLCCALAEAYAPGALAAGHHVTRLSVAALDLPLLHLPEEFQTVAPSAAVLPAQRASHEAKHWVLELSDLVRRHATHPQ